MLTHCWMDAYLIALVREAALVGRTYQYVATETRPYLQGARLTAHTLAEMGQDVTLITDSMAAAVLSPQSALGRVDALVTAADRVTMDGHVINKVGTLGHAVAAAAFGVPFYALVLAPDPSARHGRTRSSSRSATAPRCCPRWASGPPRRWSSAAATRRSTSRRPGSSPGSSPTAACSSRPGWPSTTRRPPLPRSRNRDRRDRSP